MKYINLIEDSSSCQTHLESYKPHFSFFRNCINCIENSIYLYEYVISYLLYFSQGEFKLIYDLLVWSFLIIIPIFKFEKWDNQSDYSEEMCNISKLNVIYFDRNMYQMYIKRFQFKRFIWLLLHFIISPSHNAKTTKTLWFASIAYHL